MNESSVIQVVIQGGAVGLCLVQAYIIYRMQNGQRQSFIDALDRNSKAFTDFAVAIQGLTDRIPLRRRRN